MGTLTTFVVVFAFAFLMDIAFITLEEKKLGPKLSDSHRDTTATVDSLRAGINPAPTQWVGEPSVGPGFTPARGSYHILQIAQLR
jgi:hypothetical protein